MASVIKCKSAISIIISTREEEITSLLKFIPKKYYKSAKRLENKIVSNIVF